MKSFLMNPIASKFDHEQDQGEAEIAHLIDSSHDHDEEKVQPSSNRSRKSWLPHTPLRLVAAITSTAFICLIISTLVFHLVNTSKSFPQPGTKFGSCGNTSLTARAAKCVFDTMSFSWLPPACSDPYLTSEFLALRNWTWYLGQNQKETVSLDEVVRGEHAQLFVSREYHMYHCTYMWRKLHRGMLKAQEEDGRGRGVVDTYIGRYQHTAHCEMMLLGMEGEESVDKKKTDTAILMKFPRCMYV